MRINNNTTAFSVWTDYTFHLDNLRDSMQRLSTGVIKTTDDPAGIGIAERLRAQAKSTEAARGNADDGISMMQSADSWLDKINDMLSSMQDLVIEAAGTTSPTDQANLQIEFEAYQDEITSITSNYTSVAKYNGLYMFRGGNGTTGYMDSVMTTGGRPAQKVTSPVAVVSGNASSNLISLAGGGYLVSNPAIDGSNPGVQLYDDSGSVVGGVELSVADVTSITALATGGFLTYSGGDIQRYDRYGDLVGDAMTVSSETIQDITALPNGDIVAVAGTGASEEVVTFDISLSSSTVVSVTNADDTAGAKVAVYNNGDFLVADGSGISKYDSSGTVITAGYTDVATTGDVEDIITLIDGSFIAQTGTGSSASFQRYYDNGTSYGDPITIDENVVGLQALDDGGFTIISLDDVGGGSDNVLNLHRYSADNSLFETLQASNGSNTVTSADVKVLGTGDVIAEWGENGNSYSVLFSMDAGIVTRVGPDLNQDFVIDLPDLQSNNYRIMGNYNDGTDDIDVRWSTILDSDSLTVTTTDATSILGVAIDHISSQRALLASQQNVLQNRKEGLLTYQDNLEAAESKVRDVDIALETTEFSQHEILLNSANAMIAQANTMPPSVLDLLS